eukprot:6474954-Amphidinium_carterae.2
MFVDQDVGYCLYNGDHHCESLLAQTGRLLCNSSQLCYCASVSWCPCALLHSLGTTRGFWAKCRNELHKTGLSFAYLATFAVSAACGFYRHAIGGACSFPRLRASEAMQALWQLQANAVPAALVIMRSITII